MGDASHVWPAYAYAYDEPIYDALIEHWRTPNPQDLVPCLLAACDRTISVNVTGRASDAELRVMDCPESPRARHQLESHPMRIGTLTITAPALNAPRHSEAGVFGSMACLWMNAPVQNDLPLRALPHVLLPALKQQQQHILAAELDGAALKPVAYVAWANMDAQAEQRYPRDPANGLRREN